MSFLPPFQNKVEPDDSQNSSFLLSPKQAVRRGASSNGETFFFKVFYEKNSHVVSFAVMLIHNTEHLDILNGAVMRIAMGRNGTISIFHAFAIMSILLASSAVNFALVSKKKS